MASIFYYKKTILKRIFRKNIAEISINNKKVSVILANNFFIRLKGMMFKRKKKEKEVLPILFEFKRNNRFISSLHCFFCFFEISLIFLDSENKVFEIGEIKPWRVYIPKKAPKYLIEIPKSKIKDFKININDEINIILKNQ